MPSENQVVELKKGIHVKINGQIFLVEDLEIDFRLDRRPEFRYPDLTIQIKEL